MPLDKSAIMFDGDRPQLPQISAQGGLPFWTGVGNAGETRAQGDQAPRKADIVAGGKGGGSESAPYDPNVPDGGGDNG